MLNVALEREVEGDLLLGDMGQGLGIRPGVVDGAISISAIQWLCNADKSSHEPQKKIEDFFVSLYRCLTRGAKAVFQSYPENIAQRELIFRVAQSAGFGGYFVIDYPHSTKSKKEYLFLTCPPSISSGVQKRKGEDGDSFFNQESIGDEENQTVCVFDRQRPRKRQKMNSKVKGNGWVSKKNEQRWKEGKTTSHCKSRKRMRSY